MKRVCLFTFMGLWSVTAAFGQTTLSVSAVMSSFPLSNSASHFEVTGDTLWFGTGKGMTRSVDHGLTWGTFPDKDFEHPGVASFDILGNRIWVGTVFDQKIGDGTVQTGSGYSFSNDGGVIWSHLSQVTDNPGDSIFAYGINDSVRILPVTVPEQNITWGLSLSPSTVWIASWASGLRKSTDDGQHWQRILLPADDQDSLRPTDTLWSYSSYDTTTRIFSRYDPRVINNMLCFSVYAVDADTIWCGTAGGINKSIDGGVSWTKFTHQNQSAPILGNWVIAIRPQHTGSKNRLWITNWKAVDENEEYGVSYTDNGGASWKNALFGIRAYDFAFRDSIIYVATDQGLYRSTDEGTTWQRSGTIIDKKTQQRIATQVVHAVRVVGTTVWIGTPDGIASTLDDPQHPFGSEWTVYRAYIQLGQTASVYAYPNPFSPAQEPIRIHYSTGGKTADITIDIFDFGMNRVRTLIRNVERSATQDHEELWDGRNDSAQRIANGVYFYRISIGNDQKIWGKILVLQ